MLDSTTTEGVGGGCCCDDPASVPASDLLPLSAPSVGLCPASAPEIVETEEILSAIDGNFLYDYINLYERYFGHHQQYQQFEHLHGNGYCISRFLVLISPWPEE